MNTLMPLAAALALTVAPAAADAQNPGRGDGREQAREARGGDGGARAERRAQRQERRAERRSERRAEARVAARAEARAERRAAVRADVRVQARADQRERLQRIRFQERREEARADRRDDRQAARRAERQSDRAAAQQTARREQAERLQRIRLQERREDARRAARLEDRREARLREQVRDARRDARRDEQRFERRVAAIRAAERREDRRDARRFRNAVRFVDRPAIVFRDVGLIDGCPPGLAWRNNGCLPPGQARRLARARYDYLWRMGDDDWRYRYDDGYVYRVDNRGSLLGWLPALGGALGVGQMWPAQYTSWQPAPVYYTTYYDLQPRYQYRYADGALYGVDPQTQAITQVAALLTGQDWAVGQPMPVGYDVYNVPWGYRDRYVDGPDRWYRYSDGYVYQVDPTTQLVQAAIQLIA